MVEAANQCYESAGIGKADVGAYWVGTAQGGMGGPAYAAGSKPADVRAACEKAGLLVLTAKTRLRLLPPLTITAGDVREAVRIVEEAAAAYAAG